MSRLNILERANKGFYSRWFLEAIVGSNIQDAALTRKTLDAVSSDIFNHTKAEESGLSREVWLLKEINNNLHLFNTNPIRLGGVYEKA